LARHKLTDENGYHLWLNQLDIGEEVFIRFGSININDTGYFSMMECVTQHIHNEDCELHPPFKNVNLDSLEHHCKKTRPNGKQCICKNYGCYNGKKSICGRIRK
jgi:hypothetical protein